MENILKQSYITIPATGEKPAGKIPIVMVEKDSHYYVIIDGITWFETKNVMHATVLYAMMHEHILEYMHYEMNN